MVDQELFDLMKNEHGVVLLESDAREIELVMFREDYQRLTDASRVSRILSAVPSECVWTQEEEFDSRIYSTSCGRDWTMEEGTPEENGYKFCMGCGKLIKRGIAG